MNETDRELLELAAKAAGYASWDWLSQDHWMNVYEANGRHSSWNPLTDDGDALRLAVKLHLRIDHGNYETRVFDQWEDTALALVEYKTEDNEFSATRRAIVRAAAEIGKAMQ